MNTEERGRRLKQLREARGISQNALAERAQVDQSNIVRIEGGHRKLTADMALKLVAVLGWTTTERAAMMRELGFKYLAEEQAGGLDPLPSDPLMLLTECLERGPWPQNISAAVYALLAAYADDKRSIWLRRFDEAAAEVLAEIEAASAPPPASDSASITIRRRVREDAHATTTEPGGRTEQVNEWLTLLREKLFASGRPPRPGVR